MLPLVSSTATWPVLLHFFKLFGVFVLLKCLFRGRGSALWCPLCTPQQRYVAKQLVKEVSWVFVVPQEALHVLGQP